MRTPPEGRRGKMAAPVAHPDVSKWQRRDMEIPSNKALLEIRLLDWITEVTDYIGQKEPMNNIRPASYLVATADGIDVLQYAPTPMATSANSKLLHTIFAIFLWGTKQSGQWFIRSVKFTLDKIEDAAARKAYEKQYQIDKAQDEYDSKFHAREAVFR